MSEISKMIEELCPYGVEYKKLSEICEINRGIVISKDFIRNNPGKYPVYSSQTENDGNLGNISTFKFDGEYITWTTDGAKAGTVFYRNGKFNVTNVCGLLKIINKKELNVKFLYYYLSCTMHKYVKRDMANAKLMSNVVAEIEIPIPPLSIQEKIVEILDTFTQLEAELEAELEARCQQYQYYRDSLLQFNKVEVRQVRLGDVIKNVSKIKWNNFDTEDNFHYIDLSSVNIETSKIIETSIINKENYPSRAQQVIAKNDILFGTTRPLLKRFCIVPKEYDNQICSTGYCVLRCDRKVINHKFLYFILQTPNFYDYCKAHQVEGNYPSISDNVVKEFKIPLPPLSIQEKIVEVLDNFDKVCNDLNIGLPAEIDARQKQYEYYRDMLLTFDVSKIQSADETRRDETRRDETRRDETKRNEM